MSKTHHDVRDAFAEGDQSFAKLVHVLVRSSRFEVVDPHMVAGTSIGPDGTGPHRRGTLVPP